MPDLNSITGANSISETSLKDTYLKQKRTASTQPIKPINAQNTGDTFVSSKPKENKKGLYAALTAFTGRKADINDAASHPAKELSEADKAGLEEQKREDIREAEYQRAKHEQEKREDMREAEWLMARLEEQKREEMREAEWQSARHEQQMRKDYDLKKKDDKSKPEKKDDKPKLSS